MVLLSLAACGCGGCGYSARRQLVLNVISCLRRLAAYGEVNVAHRPVTYIIQDLLKGGIIAEHKHLPGT